MITIDGIKNLPVTKLVLKADDLIYEARWGDEPEYSREYRDGDFLCEIERSFEFIDPIIDAIRKYKGFKAPVSVSHIMTALKEICGDLVEKIGVASAGIVLSQLSSLIKDFAEVFDEFDDKHKRDCFIRAKDVEYVFSQTGFSDMGNSCIGQLILSGVLVMMPQIKVLTIPIDAILEAMTEEEKYGSCVELIGANMFNEETKNLLKIEYQIEFKGKSFQHIYKVGDIRSLYMFDLSNCLKHSVHMKQCKNCNKYFPLYGRSDAIYCNYLAPGEKSKTCREVGAKNTRVKKEKADTATGEYRKLYMKIKMNALRHSEDEGIQILLKELVSDGKKWRKELSKGIVTTDQFMEWLEGMTKRYDELD